MTATAPVFSASGRPLAEWVEAPAADRAETAWRAAQRTAARQALRASGFPKPADDAWRHMGLDAVLRPAWHPAPLRPDGELPSALAAVERQPWNRLSAPPSTVAAARRHRPLGAPAAFVHLNAMMGGEACHFRVPQNVCCLQPLRLAPAPVLTPQPAPGWMVHPRYSVLLERGARLDLIVDCGHLPDAGLLNLVIDIELHENTALNLVWIGPSAPAAVALADIAASQERDSVLRLFGLETRPSVSRLDLSVSLNGENASTDLYGLALLDGDSRAYHHLNVEHRVPHTQSQQVFKSVLSGSSRFEYDSLVTIRPEAPHASSEQLNKNLLLADTARAFARPQLAILTDEVQCHHGATVGQMNPEELFYLRTRGIDPATASELVLRGFVDDLLKEVPVAAVAAELQQKAHLRLEEIAR